MQTKNPLRGERRPRRDDEHRDQLPTWRNTQPRGNAQIDDRDLQRSAERLEMVLGR